MLRYVVRRLILFIPLLIGLSLVVFFYIHLVPGDPIAGMLRYEGNPEIAAKIRHEFGLDRPIYIQYFDWLNKALHGDLGMTFRARYPIAPLLLDRIPATLELALGALVVAILIALPAGIIAGLNKNSAFDYIFSLFSLIGYSTPVFWSGYILILLLAVRWHMLPSQGYVPFNEDPWRNLQHLLMPAFTLVILLAPYVGRMTRAAIIETMQDFFVLYARAKGLKRHIIFWRYILRHAIISILVVLGLDIGYLLSGQILIEEMFNWPGVGRLIVRGVLERDYFVVQATVLVYAGLFLLVNLIVELLHGWLDPRVHLE
jgi:peptide/nickel transport system permease protein